MSSIFGLARCDNLTNSRNVIIHHLQGAAESSLEYGEGEEDKAGSAGSDAAPEGGGGPQGQHAQQQPAQGQPQQPHGHSGGVADPEAAMASTSSDGAGGAILADLAKGACVVGFLSTESELVRFLGLPIDIWHQRFR